MRILPFTPAPTVTSLRDPLQPGSSLYYAVRHAPPATRPHLENWVRWWHEVSVIPFAVQDPGVAEQKLAWWQQEVQRMHAGQAQHPRTTAMLQSPTTPPQDLWQSQLQALMELIHQGRWLDEAGQRKHALATTGAAAEAAAWILGARSEAARASARELGVALRQAHDLARLGQDARRGWLHVPISTLQAHDIKAHELLKPSSERPAPANWPALLTYLQNRTVEQFAQFHQQRRQLERAERQALLPLAVLADLQQALIHTIADQGARVLQERIILTPLRKWWISSQSGWQRKR